MSDLDERVKAAWEGYGAALQHAKNAFLEEAYYSGPNEALRKEVTDRLEAVEFAVSKLASVERMMERRAIKRMVEEEAQVNPATEAILNSKIADDLDQISVRYGYRLALRDLLRRL